MVERWGAERLAQCKFGGNSAGALIAVAAAKGMPWEQLERVYLRLAGSAAQNGVIGKMSSYHAAALDTIIDDETHIVLAGRLFVGITYPTGYEVSSSWASRGARGLARAAHARAC
jgi:hypothetical protein